MKQFPFGKLTVYTTTTNVPTVINTPVNNATSVNTQSHINNRIPPVHPPPHTVNPTNSHLPNVNTILSPSVHNVDNSNTTPSITSTYLYDLLTPTSCTNTPSELQCMTYSSHFHLRRLFPYPPSPLSTDYFRMHTAFTLCFPLYPVPAH